MEIYEAIEKRYSVRTFEDRCVEDDTLQRVLNAGRLAPSGRNRQDWKFVVVRDPDLRKDLGEACEQAWVAQAPVIIAVVGLMPDRVMYCGVPADPVDCAIAIDHMAVPAAVGEGLGSCWVGHFSQEACCELLDVPPGAKIIELLALGYPAGDAPAKSRKALAEVVCYDRFT